MRERAFWTWHARTHQDERFAAEVVADESLRGLNARATLLMVVVAGEAVDRTDTWSTFFLVVVAAISSHTVRDVDAAAQRR